MATTTAKQSVKFNVVFGIVGHDKIPANAAVLLNKRKMQGVEVQEFMAVEGVKSTKPTDLVMPILAVMLADARIRGGFAAEFEVCKVGSKVVETNLKAKSAFTKWLRGDAIYKSNSEGVLNKALALDKGLLLRDTALRVTEKQGIFHQKGDTLRVVLHKTCEAIVKQASLFSAIKDEATGIYKLAYTEEKPKASAKPKATAKSKAKPAAQPTAQSQSVAA